MTADADADRNITRPIIGIENRTAVEVFDIMCDRIRRAHARQPGEPVAWQWRYRVRAIGKNQCGPWGDWRDGRAPVLRTEIYEAEDRPLYAHPAPPAPVAVPDTAWEMVEAVFKQFSNDLAAGYKTRDKEFGVALLGKAMELRALSPSPASPEKGTERLREALEELLGCCDAVCAMQQREVVDRHAMSRARAALASLPAEPEGEDAWLIYYHDQDVRPEIFTGSGAEAAARASWAQEQINWTCDLFRSVRRDMARATHPTAPKPAEVKELEWEAAPPELQTTRFLAKSEVGTYYVREDAWRPEGCVWLAANGIENAKAAAQADYERRILSALEPSPAPAAEEFRRGAEAPTEEPDFVQGLQGFASMCESSARTGGMSPDDCNMVAGKLRDACFLIDTLQKLRDGKIALGWQLVPAPAAEEAFWPTHRHVKSGSGYRVIGEAEAQVSTGTRIPFFAEDGSRSAAMDWFERELSDGDRLTVYQGTDGKLWVRFSDEFNDGRFIPLTSGEG